MEQLITAAQVSELSRPITKHFDVNLLNAYIREVEDLNIKPLFGTNYELVKTNEDVVDKLRRAVAYYVYAKIVSQGATIVTRSGAVEKTDEYSVRIDQQRKDEIFRECNAMADKYLNEAVEQFGKEEASKVSPIRRMSYIVGE